MESENRLENHVRTYDLEKLKDVVNHGCASGVIGELIYYPNTSRFHDKFEEEIWDILYNESDSFGENIMSFIANLNGSKDVGGIDQLKNLLSWYAFEHFARIIVEEGEKE